MNRTDILDAARQAVTVDRAATHGQLEDSFGLVAAYWSAHLGTPVSRSDVAVMMIQLKLAMRGGPIDRDGLSRCVQDVCAVHRVASLILLVIASACAFWIRADATVK